MELLILCSICIKVGKFVQERKSLDNCSLLFYPLIIMIDCKISPEINNLQWLGVGNPFSIWLLICYVSLEISSVVFYG